jgi:hypothetical protein
MRDRTRVMSRMPLPLRLKATMRASVPAHSDNILVVVNDDFWATHLPQILLFSVGSCAIHFDVQRETLRTAESFGLYDASLTCPSLFSAQH